MAAVHREGMDAILSTKGSSSRAAAGIRERIMETLQRGATHKVPVASTGGRAMNSLLPRMLSRNLIVGVVGERRWSARK